MKNRLGVTIFMNLVFVATASSAQEANIDKRPAEIYLKDPKTVLGGSTSSILSIDDLKSPDAAKTQVPTTARDLEAIGKSLIESNPTVFELNTTDMEVKGVRTGLAGSSVDFQQNINGIPVLGGIVGVTIDKTGEIISVSKSLVNVPEGKLSTVAKEYSITDAVALDIVAADLAPSGQLIEGPKVTKAYVAEGNALTLAYIVTLAVQQPFGYWEYHIDGVSGRIIERLDRSIRRKKGLEGTYNTSLNLPPLQLSLGSQTAHDISAKAPKKSGNFFTVPALIFAPNPVTALDRADLRDSNNASDFDPAYQRVDLVGVSKESGRYSLSGQSVRIADFEPGEHVSPPSTTLAEWTAKRGENAFNDVMVFYYLNQSIDYLRALGYENAAELFPNAIAADSDGMNNDDNSHYVSGSDVLAFGHGGVDDPEDSDVILHELGHAITYHINPNWGGGDSGAIGEGFGDYWAVSYRLRLANGMRPDPGVVFPWDGTVWGGRRVDVATAQYDPTRTYRAHELVNGVPTDELWSTPLVEALFDLKTSGVALEKVDQIVLEGMRDVGTNFTMRTLAANTVKKAELLFPGTDYGVVFAKRFKQHNILP